MSELIQSFLDNKFDKHCHALEVFNNGELLASGSGRLYSDFDRQLILEICASIDELSRDTLTPIPSPLFFKGSLSPTGIPFEGYCTGGMRSYCLAANQNIWTLPVSEISFSVSEAPYIGRTTRKFQSRVIIYLNQFPWCTFTKEHKTIEADDEFFGISSISYPILSFASDSSQFALRISQRQRGEAAILTPTADLDQLTKLCKAWQFALSLRWGYRMESVALQISTPQIEIVKLIPDVLPAPHRGKWTYPPLNVQSYDDKTNEELLQKAISFHLLDNQIGLEAYMDAFWESALAESVHVRESILGSIIEGLAKDIIAKFSPDLLKTSSSKKKELQQLKECCLKPLCADPDCQNNPLFDQFRKAINNISLSSAKTEIQSAASLIGFELETSDLKAWGQMRNDASHGLHIKKKLDINRSTNFHACAGILTKFSLALIGYEGRFQDYGAISFSERQFKINLPPKGIS